MDLSRRSTRLRISGHVLPWWWRWHVGLLTALVLLPAILGVGGNPVLAAEPGTRAGLTVWPEPRPVPEIRFVDGEGKPRSLADFRGKVVLLNIWATWCVPCREEMPTLDRLQGQLGGPDFQVVALSVDQDGLPVVRDFYREIGIQHLEMFVDDSMQAIQDLGAFGLPATLLLDRQGREVGRKLGAANWDGPEVVQYLREVIATAQGK